MFRTKNKTRMKPTEIIYLIIDLIINIYFLKRKRTICTCSWYSDCDTFRPWERQPALRLIRAWAHRAASGKLQMCRLTLRLMLPLTLYWPLPLPLPLDARCVLALKSVHRGGMACCKTWFTLPLMYESLAIRSLKSFSIMSSVAVCFPTWIPYENENDNENYIICLLQLRPRLEQQWTKRNEMEDPNWSQYNYKMSLNVLVSKYWNKLKINTWQKAVLFIPCR